ncbi:hypothetical protein FACS1894211_10970 [Clostridia bacterium]|nr:hypothetical protein FACS1894211_10970 [Clostridia bacterium]
MRFGFSYIEGGPWNDDGIKAVAKFTERVERLINAQLKGTGNSGQRSAVSGQLKAQSDHCEWKLFPTPAVETAESAEVLYVYHNTVKSMTADFEIFSFNTAVARYMELVNALYKYDASAGKDAAFLKELCRNAVKLIAPLAPVLAQKWYGLLGKKKDVFKEAYPEFDESRLKRAETEYAVQINSKVRARIPLPSDADSKALERAALDSEAVRELLGEAAPKKVIVIPGRLINIIL